MLNDNLNGTSDRVVMWANSGDPKARQFAHLNQTLAAFREMLKNADSGALLRYLSLVPEFGEPVPRPRAVLQGDRTPLLMQSPAETV